MHELLPEAQRDFALEVVRKLRSAGYEALWAGGCVRDLLLDRTPKDYDVATNARPGEIRGLFGHRRTLAIGAAYGVITVKGRRGAGQVEVATFRSDDQYDDGRRPKSVRFSDARQDAQRRDFTVNGLFFDPIRREVVDYVGGREDLQRRVIRAIGDPVQRFGEDKLRLLRAIRFATVLDFAIDPPTLEAVGRMAGQIGVVSPERITAELQRILTEPHRSRGVELLLETGLAAEILPELVLQDRSSREHALAVLDRLPQATFPCSLAVLFHGRVEPDGAREIAKRWRMSNHDADRAAWLLANYDALSRARSKRWSALQRILIAEGIEDLLAIREAEARTGNGDAEDAAWCRAQLARPPAELDPPPLATGDDLIRHGIRPGPAYRRLLEQLRDAQLDGQIVDRRQALALADQLLQQGPCPEEP
jgi:tRNA nucleotidyltransferase/poly(A) polymerase